MGYRLSGTCLPSSRHHHGCIISLWSQSDHSGGCMWRTNYKQLTKFSLGCYKPLLAYVPSDLCRLNLWIFSLFFNFKNWTQTLLRISMTRYNFNEKPCTLNFFQLGLFYQNTTDICTLFWLFFVYNSYKNNSIVLKYCNCSVNIIQVKINKNRKRSRSSNSRNKHVLSYNA